ncbi:aconitase domain protein [Oesophagostomum dentatum]|uniref:Aconitase domain protein n=1 Tax=Oesophagostomum dentatum TaxID=61180 RepID=A0A0B1TPT1_OESDE|nr:aconitase domain protein [Oesophagostomum dentatum]
MTYKNLLKDLVVDGKTLKYFDLTSLDHRYDELPISIRYLLEAAVRHCDGFHVLESDVETILNWKHSQTTQSEIPFKPARVILQDFTGVPAVVDLAAMRDAVQKLGADPSRINPICPVDLVIDHSIQNLRRIGVVGKFVEFFGEGVASLSIADRATIANMCPEYGATIGFFPVDKRTVQYLRQTGRDEQYCGRVESYLKANKLFVDYADSKFRPAYTKVIVIAGKEYGCGSSRDWAAKGPYLLGVKAVIAESFERIHRSNLIGMGIVPLQFQTGENAETLGLTGKERYSIHIPDDLKTGQLLKVTLSTGKSFEVICRFDTEVELTYYRNGGILQYVIRNLIKE